MNGRPIDRREALSRTARAGAALYALGSIPFLTRCAPSGRRPNIVLIFSDDHAPHAISAYGSRINRTPNIDRIADEGAIFLNSFCTNSICGPSRAVVLTGKHSHVNGKLVNGGQPFDMTQWTFNQAVQAAGYQTAIIGKWHLGVEPGGFDHWEVLPGQGRYRVAPHYGVRTDRYKLVYYYRTREWELFDLEADPSELRNVYASPEYAEVVPELTRELGRLRSAYRDTTGEEFVS